MENKTNVSDDVLHSSNHSKLSAEEIAKALARHNRHHPESKAAPTAGKPQTAPKQTAPKK